MTAVAERAYWADFVTYQCSGFATCVSPTNVNRVSTRHLQTYLHGFTHREIINPKPSAFTRIWSIDKKHFISEIQRKIITYFVSPEVVSVLVHTLCMQEAVSHILGVNSRTSGLGYTSLRRSDNLFLVENGRNTGMRCHGLRPLPEVRASLSNTTT